MAETVPVLEADGVDKRYSKGAVALAGVDLAVYQGETVAVIGESGSGKTTLLRVFNRMVEPSGGEARVGGVPVGGRDPIELRRGIGYVPQQGGLIPHWTVGRNVELVPRLLGWELARRRYRVREMLELVGLKPLDHAARYPHQLSGGQRQRVALARALAAEPEVVLLDEPFGALDALTRLELRREFRRIQRQAGLTALLVTHDLDEAFQLADRIAVMREGKILQTAPAEELRQRPADPYVRELLAMAQGTE